MEDTELEKKRNAGAPDLSKWEKKVRDEVETEFPNLSPDAKRAIIDSRLKIDSGSSHPKLIKDDFGGNASRKIKDKLFE